METKDLNGSNDRNQLQSALLSRDISVLVGALLVLSVNDDVLVGGLHSQFVGAELRHVNHHLIMETHPEFRPKEKGSKKI